MLSRHDPGVAFRYGWPMRAPFSAPIRLIAIDAVDLGEVGLGERAARADPGIVEQHVEPAAAGRDERVEAAAQASRSRTSIV